MRNIVLITLESVRADRCGFMDYKRNTTPFLDEMAESDRSMVFENAVAPGTYTSESVISLFTGDNSRIVPDAGGAEMSPQPWRRELKNRKTLAEALSEEGYATLGFSPNPLTSSYYGFDSGFDFFRDFLREDNHHSPSIFGKIKIHMVWWTLHCSLEGLLFIHTARGREKDKPLFPMDFSYRYTFPILSYSKILQTMEFGFRPAESYF